MSKAMVKGLLSRIKPGSPSKSSEDSGALASTPMDKLFPKTNPLIDGEDCLHDCESCTIKYPNRFDIETKDELYGQVKQWDTHLIVATSKTDWVRDVADEKGSIMEAVEKSKVQPINGPLKLSASNMPLPDAHHHAKTPGQAMTRVLLLPAMLYIDNVTPSRVPALITNYVNSCSSNTSPLAAIPRSLPTPPPESDQPDADALIPSACPHQYLILLCSQKTRDARCGQSAPLLRREFERHLRPLGLYRDLNDERPGGVGIYFISHVGGHKYSANVLIYRRAGSAGAEVPAAADGSDDADAERVTGSGRRAGQEAAQCIWLARVVPADCENIVKYTVLQGKVVKPESQLRGGFDRTRGLASW